MRKHVTHWEGCEQEHHQCALAQLRKAEEQLLDARAKLALAAENEAGLEEWKREQIDAYAELEARLAALLEPGEYGGLLEMIEHEARIWPDSPLERLLRATATAIEQLQAQKREAEAKLAECMEATSPGGKQMSVTLSPTDLANLCTFSFGMSCDAPEDAMTVTIGWLDDHENGPSWYVWATEYPKEGSIPLLAAAKEVAARI